MSNRTLESGSIINTPLGVGAMQIQLEQAGKRYNRDWIFRKLSYTFQQGNAYAIIGANGSGKSTLLQAIAGSTNISEGKLLYWDDRSQKTEDGRQKIEDGRQKIEDRGQMTDNGRDKEEDRSEMTEDRTTQSQISNFKSSISSDSIYQYLSIAAPYLELIEEMSAVEFLHFHASFKPLSISVQEIIQVIGLEKAAHKQIRYYSSGMKQRVKLAQAIFSVTPILLLDEPCTNLDKTGYQLYHQLIENYCSNKLIIVSSNDENEMDFCSHKINMLDYK